MFAISKIAVENARKNKGPALIECMTYRWLEHVGHSYDYDLGYRNKKELDRWMKRCPLKLFEQRLLKKRLISHSFLKRMKDIIKKEIGEAVCFAKSSQFPPEEEAYRDIYN